MIQLLEELVCGLSVHLESDPASPEKGALFCQYHGDHHTRGAEAAFPFVFLGMHKRDNDLMEKGFCLADWLLTRQNADGSWYESPDTWTGTTVFQLMALAALTDTGRDHIAAERMADYEQSIRKAAEWVRENSRFRMVTTNYVASGAAALALVSRVFPEEKWEKEAGRLARLAAGRISKEGLVEGEGRGRRILKKIYIPPKGIDIGYGLEMMLGALGIYAVLCRDEKTALLTESAIQSHLSFIYPDGTLDNSLGSRGYKWTVYGSKTAHGAQMALAFAASRNPEMQKYLPLSLEALRNCFRNGLLTDGPAAEPESGEFCLYPSLMRAQNLAFALRYFPEAQQVPANENHGENPLWFKSWKGLNSITLHRHPWRATVSACGDTTFYPEKEFTFFVPGGGSLTRLHLQNWGNVQAATQLEYRVLESLHVPAVENPVPTFTPGILLRTASGTLHSAYSRDTAIACFQEKDCLRVRASGHFYTAENRKLRCGFSVEYRFAPEGLRKDYHVHLQAAYESVEISEPIIVLPDMRFQQKESEMVFRQGEKEIRIAFSASSGIWSLSPDAEIVTCPLPALKALPLAYCLPQPEKGKYSVSVAFQIEGMSMIVV